VTGTVSEAADTASERTPDARQVKQGARQAVGIAQENPLGMAIGSVAVGFVVGMLLPTTRVEEEKVAPVAGQIREKAMETGQEALEHGRQVAQQVAETGKEAVAQAVDQTKDAAKESGRQHAEEVKETARQQAGEARDEVRSQRV
jgi:gas vesicle protein